MSNRATLASQYTLMFWCPGCDEAHCVSVNGPNPWTWNESLELPTLSPSVLVRGGHYLPGHTGNCWCTYDWQGQEPYFKCRQCHSFVRDGKIEFLSDCSHSLAGQTVDLPLLENT